MPLEQVANLTTQYAVTSIQSQIQAKTTLMVLKFIFSALAGIGVANRDLRQIRAFLVAVMGILSAWALIDLAQIIALALK